MTVAYQGEPGAFSEEAVLAFFGDLSTRAVPTWRAVFESVRDGDVDAGVVAIESSLGGDPRDLRPSLRSFTTGRSGSSARSAFPSDSPSLRCRASRSTEIERVYSHAQALAQAMSSSGPATGR